MPRVPVYGQPRVSSRPLPGPRRTATPGPDAFGAQLGDTAAVIGTRLIERQEAFRRQEAEQARNRANDLAVRRAVSDLKDWETRRLHDPNDGAFTQRGQAALGLPETIGAEFDREAARIASTLTTPEQRDGFEAQRLPRKSAVLEGVMTHVSSEWTRIEDQEFTRGLTNSQTLAIANALNPRRVAEELQSQVDTVRAHAAARGLGPEATAAMVLDTQSTTHVGVIGQLLAHEQDRAARVYFEAAKGQIHGEQLVRIEEALAEGSIRGESQRQSDEIVRTAKTLTEARERVRAIMDPKLRDAVQTRVEHEFSLKEREGREREEQLLKGAYTAVERGGIRAVLNTPVWAALSGSDRSALRSYARSLAEGVSIKTDMGALYTLLTLSSTDPDAFMKTNLLRYRDRLSNADLEQMMRTQTAMRSGKEAPTLFASEDIQNEVIDAGLASLGLNLAPAALRDSPDTQQRVDAFRRAVREAVDRQFPPKDGKRPTREAVQSIVDTLIAPTGGRDNGFFRSPTPVYAFETPQAHVTKASEVPVAERRKIEAALRNRNLPISDAAIVQLFNAQLARVRGDR